MKRLSVLLLLLIVGLSGQSQYKIQKVSNNLNTTLDGIVYALPQTVLRIDVSLLKTEKVPGPLAAYAEDYLGVNNYISKPEITYSFVDAKISSLSEADPEQLFYLQFPTQRSKDEPVNKFLLDRNSCVISYNAVENMVNNINYSQPENATNVNIFQNTDNFNYNAVYNRKKIIDTIIKKINIDTVTIDRFVFKTNWSSLSDRDKANEAALKIEKIREQRFNLLTGFQEVNYGNSIVYMDSQLKKMEEDYVDLFLGKEKVSTENYTLYLVPSKGDKTKSLLDTGYGQLLEIEFVPFGNTKNLPDKPLLKENHMFYRQPEKVNVKLKFDNKYVKSENIFINQFGKLLMAPMGNNSLYFDPVTGNLTGIIKR